jgi:FK506-binding nuclear protein
MAAIDPSAVPQLDGDNKVARATLKLIRLRGDFGDSDISSDEEDDEDYSEDDIEAIKERLRGIISDEEMSDEDEDSSEDEKNGGPSDPAKTKQARKDAMTKKLQEELDEMELDGLTNGSAKGKGKGKITDDDEEIDSDDLEGDDNDDDDEAEELVICTLDPEKVWVMILYDDFLSVF